MENPIDHKLLQQLGESKGRLAHIFALLAANEQEPESTKPAHLQSVSMYRVAYLNGRAGYWGRLEAGEHIVIQDMTKPDFMTGYAYAAFVYKWGKIVATYYGNKREIDEVFQRYGDGYYLDYDTYDSELVTLHDLEEIINLGFK
jgi:hypothetical protein